MAGSLNYIINLIIMVTTAHITVAITIPLAANKRSVHIARKKASKFGNTLMLTNFPRL
jgi:hypothetical protein